MFQIHISQITSKTMCRFMAQTLRTLARDFDFRADEIEQYRGNIELDYDDLNDYRKAAKRAILDPDYSSCPNDICTRISAQYGLKGERVHAIARNMWQVQKRDVAKKQRQRIYKMYLEGFKQIKIAKKLGVSAPYVNKTIKDYPDRIEAERKGLSLPDYRRFFKKNL